VGWTKNEHPTNTAQRAFRLQNIRPTDPGDPQQNPQTEPAAVQLLDRGFTPEAERLAVADSLERWYEAQNMKPEQERDTCSVLVPRGDHGVGLAGLLKQRGIRYVELLRSTSVTRETAGALGNLLRCLADPTSSRKLATAFQVWRRDDRDDPEAKARTEAVSKRIRGCQAVEAYLWPRVDHDWLAPLTTQLSEDELALLIGFREVARRWHQAALLLIDQLILTLANDLFREPAELALAHKLAGLLRNVADARPTYRLVELVEELAVIARNERRFMGFTAEDTAFKPPEGQVTVTTMHKAKGLEWDRVYLMSVNSFDFPSGVAHDIFQDEKWFIRDGLNLKAEALAQLKVLVSLTMIQTSGEMEGPMEGDATRVARQQYISERLRLLYVGITRAKRELVITWNTGRRRAEKLQPAVPFIALHQYWKQNIEEDS
jgi:DNA helicase-2/ATP-dependent DNA helicase PcrA